MRCCCGAVGRAAGQWGGLRWCMPAHVLLGVRPQHCACAPCTPRCSPKLPAAGRSFVKVIPLNLDALMYVSQMNFEQVSEGGCWGACS